ncbi:cell wall biogenesis protein [bacterium F11]|nr:cell wall biogenesis protein [bacterium F11]
MIKDRVIPFGRPWVTEEDRQAVMEVLKGDVLTHGPQCKSFEEEFSGFMKGEGHSISVSSGMAALHLSYFQMGIGKGDEVIVPAMTHTATVHAVEVMGARPIFVDCELKTGNIDINQIENRISPHTKAIGLVHFLGIPCQMDQLMDLAGKYKLKVVEDCALAIGSRFAGKHVGLFGESGCFSFYPIKQMTTGEGGMFVTAHSSVAQKVHKARAFGVDRSFSERSIPGMYDVKSLGLNYRMSDINATLGRCQLRRMYDIFNRRKENFEYLKSKLSGIEDLSILDANHPKATNSYYCLSVVLLGKLGDKRDELVAKLKASGIGTSIYYPQPVPRFTYYKDKYGYNEKEYPNAVLISDRSIALPVGPHLKKDDMEYIGDRFQQIVKEVL